MKEKKLDEWEWLLANGAAERDLLKATIAFMKAKKKADRAEAQLWRAFAEYEKVEKL